MWNIRILRTIIGLTFKVKGTNKSIQEEHKIHFNKNTYKKVERTH